ncbi:molybdopterin-binding protein [Desulforhopalus singaporensis]|uniref:Oxidoreductase molybdopterin binding domain-containing protein n=1 Tax=Desulforhopalus singaporensis TaxID=91360 RepID=A0A1H0RTG1_9BACT|nr:hypothetical protein [Desulforhopalus singaporensis]SDP32649.1 hypothetical protein SAMN05660330_02414 [Desulforhopalus singaporensis]
MTGHEKKMFSVTGRLHRTRDYSLQELLAMDKVKTGDLLFACGSGDPKGRIETIKGVLLTDIINGAEVVTADHNDTKKMYVVVTAADGYLTLFSWQELFNTAVGEGVMIILEKEGKKIYAEHGTVDLFSANDFLTGPRYVKQVKTIRIIMVEP